MLPFFVLVVQDDGLQSHQLESNPQRHTHCGRTRRTNQSVLLCLLVAVVAVFFLWNGDSLSVNLSSGISIVKGV